MFTGLVEAKGRVAASEAEPFGRRLTVDVGDWRGRTGELAVGASIAVQGVCLTVAEAVLPHLRFDVVAETLSASTLGHLQAGDPVNLESSLTPTTAMGGHFVQGHVDGVGRVTEVRRDDTAHVLVVEPPPSLMDYLPTKGSVTVEGVSLTIAAVTDAAFEIALIPTTIHETTLGELQVGDRANLETDMLARAVVHWLRRQGGDDGGKQGVSWSTLRGAGFVS